MWIDDIKMRLNFGEVVTVNDAKKEQLIKFVAGNDAFKGIKPFDWRDDNYWLPDSKGNSAISQFFTLGNAVNFRYWDLEGNNYRYLDGQKGKVHARGAHYMWRCLKVAYDNDEFDIFDVKKLASMEISQLKKIFKDDNDESLMPHLEERLMNWNDLGLKLYEFWDGEFYNLVKESKNSLYRFVQLSRQFRAFDDPLCKLTMVNTILHKGRSIMKFDENAFPGIDYHLVEENLRIGVLIPEETTANKLKRREILEKDEARELRNACLRVFLDLMEKTGINGEVLDNKWWSNKKYCTEDSPICQDPINAKKCVFLNICDKNTSYKIPLEFTRYY